MHMEVSVHITAEKAGPSLLEIDPFIVSFCSRKHWKRSVISNDGFGKRFSN